MAEEEQQLPRLFYPTTDVGLLPKLNQRISGGEMKALKLHLMCEDSEGCHRVPDQKGRTLLVKWKNGGYNLPIMKYAVALLWAGVGLATNLASHGSASIVFPPMDDLIRNLFNEFQIPIPVDMLAEIVNYHKPGRRLSDPEIVDVLEKYMTMDPSANWLKSFLDLQVGADKFIEDFGLYKVRYKKTGAIAWLCLEHFVERYKQRLVESEHH